MNRIFTEGIQFTPGTITSLHGTGLGLWSKFSFVIRYKYRLILSFLILQSPNKSWSCMAAR